MLVSAITAVVGLAALSEFTEKIPEPVPVTVAAATPSIV
jgi:hypothetical protein